MGLIRYGKDWGNVHPGLVELSLYSSNYNDPELSYKHLARAYLELWPKQKETFFSWQSDVFKYYCANKEKRTWILSLAGGSATSKSFTSGIIGLLEWLADPENTAVLIASTTMSDLRARVWRYVEEFYNSLPFEVGALTQHPSPQIKIKGAKGGGIFAIPVKSSREANNLIGRHPKKLIIIVDESTEFDSSILQNLPNWSAAGKIFKMIATGNSKNREDLHGVLSEPIDGWGDLNQDLLTGWPTKYGYCCLFDHMKSPVYKKPELSTILPFLKTKAQVEEEIVKLGAENPIFLRFTRSHWTETGQSMTVLDRKILDVCNSEKTPIKWAGKSKIKIASIDPAWTSGGDDCIFRIAELGQQVNGRWVLDLMGEQGVVVLNINDRSAVTPLYQVAQQIMEQCSIHGILPENLVIDATGGGVGCAEILSHEWSPDFMKIIASESASDVNIGLPDGKTSKDVYFNRVAELWFNFRTLAMNKQIRNLDRLASEEFISRQWSYSGKKMKLETKKEYKQRVGNPFMPGGSPDRADAATYLVELAVARFNFGLDAVRQIEATPLPEVGKHQAAIDRHFYILAQEEKEKQERLVNAVDWGWGYTKRQPQRR